MQKIFEVPTHYARYLEISQIPTSILLFFQLRLLKYKFV